MARRRAMVTESSLELLLDTMCNSFGGIMFIALLVAILSQFAEVRETPPVQASRAASDLAARRATLQEELRQQRAAEEQLSAVSEAIEAHPNRVHLPKLMKLQADNEAAARQRDQLAANEHETRQRAQAVAADVQQMDDQSHEIESELAAARDTAEKNRTTRELRLPRIRETLTMSYWIIVKEGRLVLLRKNRNGVVNRDVVAYKDGEGQEIFTALPGKGIRIAGKWTADVGVQALLNECAPALINLQFAVYPDSYAAFIVARDYFTGRGYEYNWVPMGADEDLILVPGHAPVQ